MKKYLYILLCYAMVLTACANRGLGPQGGPKDSIPPIPVKSVPASGSVGFHGKHIEVTFNEYIQLSNVSQNMLMSPPQQTPPDVKARGKRLIVNLADSLRDSTTYTIDFGDAVCDFTENNPLHGYSFAFSTGPEIDTLELYGRVFNAEDLNPVLSVYAGIHDNMDDSAFTSLPFTRIARTDSTGTFRIGNMRAGRYRLYALDDVSRDYRLTPGEALAFADEWVTASAPVHVFRTDTVAGDSLPAASVALQADSVALDTVPADSVHSDTVALPVEMVNLFLFRPQQQRLYLQRTLREEQHRVTILFSSSPDSLPELRVLRPSELDSARSDSAWVDPAPYILTCYSANRDTVSLWLTDSIAIGIDSLFLEARYRRTDSAYNLEWYTDTLRAIWRAPKLSARAREAQERKNSIRRLTLKSNASKSFELYDTLRLVSATPIASVERDSVHLFRKVDTLLKPVPFEMRQSVFALTFMADLKPGEQYELHIDSAAIRDVYGVTHIPGTYKLQLKTPADYSTIRVKLTPYDSRARIQLLNGKDKPVRELPAEPEGTFFQFLKPDTYYMRLYLDVNGDGQWTTGDWNSRRQPEPVYYYTEKIQTKSNWDFEEEWDYTSVPRTAAKPKELLKASSSKKK